MRGDAAPVADFGGEDHTGGQWGAVVTRGGYLLHEWGDRHYPFQTASVGKAFTRALVGLAVEEGMVNPSDLICETWTGVGQLSHRHKYLNEGHHAKLTWNHLLGPRDGAEHFGGFAIELGNDWHWAKRPRAQSTGSSQSGQSGPAIPSTTCTHTPSRGLSASTAVLVFGD